MIQATAHWIYASFQFTSKTIVIFIIRDALVESLRPNYFVCQRFRKQMPLHDPRMQSRGHYLANIYSDWRCGQKNIAKETTNRGKRHYYARTPRTEGEHMFLLSVCAVRFLQKVFLTNNLCSVCTIMPNTGTRQPPTAKNAKRIFFIFVHTCYGRWLCLVAWLPGCHPHFCKNSSGFDERAVGSSLPDD